MAFRRVDKCTIAAIPFSCGFKVINRTVGDSASIRTPPVLSGLESDFSIEASSLVSDELRSRTDTFCSAVRSCWRRIVVTADSSRLSIVRVSCRSSKIKWLVIGLATGLVLI